MNDTMPLLAALGAFGSILLIIAGAVQGRTRESVRERLERVARRRTTAADEDLRRPVTERVWRPIISWIAAPIARFTPEKVSERTLQSLRLAGLSRSFDVATFMAVRVLACLGVVLFCIAAGTVFGKNAFVGVPFGIGGGILAYLLPSVWVHGRAKSRQQSISSEMPDALDLLMLCIEAMSFERALARVVDHTHGVLHEELSQVRSDLKLYPRSEVLRDFADRTGVDEVRIFATALIQAEKLGTPLVKVLRTLSEDIRLRRKQRVETLAREAPIKMMFPLVLLVLPPLFIVILGPAVPEIMHSIVPGMRL